jgi:hypothetical protein
MNKAEFTDRVPSLKYEDLNAHDFKIINTVYAHHPMISDTNGKKEIADLYKKGGMGIMNDMYPTASELALHESNIQANNVALENLIAEQKKELARLIEQQGHAVNDLRNDNIAANTRILDIHEAFAS